MRRIVVEVAAGLLVDGSAIASSPPACADTFPRGLKVSHLVRVSPGWSVGLVTAAGGGKVRHDEDYMAETSIKVAPTSWVGTMPTTLWVDGGVVVDHPTDGRLMTVRASATLSTPEQEDSREVDPTFHDRTSATS